MSRIFFLSFPSPNSTRTNSASSSEKFTHLFVFHSIRMFFLSASKLMLFCVIIFMMAQFLPISLATLVLLFPRSTPTPSSSVKESFFHNTSSSSAVCTLLPIFTPQGITSVWSPPPPRPHPRKVTLTLAASKTKTCVYVYRDMRALYNASN